MAVSAKPRLIGLDWGTSSLRAYLLDSSGELLDCRSTGHGIQHLPAGGFVEAFRDIAGDWVDRFPELPILAAGMVGSRNGWHEAPYVPCPADITAVGRALRPFASECGTIHLVPGLSQGGSRPDVMRGEETQIVGALAQHPELTEESLVVLPGTHCKWATVRAGCVTQFTTYLTGELFALLRDHSILGRPAKEAAAAAPAAGDQAAFLQGVQAACASGAAGITGRLFSTRSLLLGGQLQAGQTLEYLSGLLIGEEIRSVLVAIETACPPLVLLGDPALCDRYRLALSAFGIPDVRPLQETGPAGLWHIALSAGLVLNGSLQQKVSGERGQS